MHQDAFKNWFLKQKFLFQELKRVKEINKELLRRIDELNSEAKSQELAKFKTGTKSIINFKKIHFTKFHSLVEFTMLLKLNQQLDSNLKESLEREADLKRTIQERDSQIADLNEKVEAYLNEKNLSMKRTKKKKSKFFIL